METVQSGLMIHPTIRPLSRMFHLNDCESQSSLDCRGRSCCFLTSMMGLATTPRPNSLSGFGCPQETGGLSLRNRFLIQKTGARARGFGPTVLRHKKAGNSLQQYRCRELVRLKIRLLRSNKRLQLKSTLGRNKKR